MNIDDFKEAIITLQTWMQTMPESITVEISCINGLHNIMTKVGSEAPKFTHLDYLAKAVFIDDDRSIDEKQIEEIYAMYPRQRDPKATRSAIKRALNDAEIPFPKSKRAPFLALALALYRKSLADKQQTRDFIPYPATWFNRKSYLNAKDLVVKLMVENAPSIPSDPQRLYQWAQSIMASASQKDAWSQRQGGSASSAPSTSAWPPRR